MSVSVSAGQGDIDPGDVAFGPTRRALHRLKAVRKAEGISRGVMATRLSTDVSAIERQEEETTDLPLSLLYQWQAVLQVPLTELLVDPNDTLSPAVALRAKLVRLMKTAGALRAHAGNGRLGRIADAMVQQLLEMMPELKDVSPWNEVGRRRSSDELGRSFHRGVDFSELMRQLAADA